MTIAYHIDNFNELLNQEFSIHFSRDAILPAKLIKVESSKSSGSSATQAFSIIFKTAQMETYYNQGTFLVKHPKFGEQFLFLVPLGPDENGMLYEAVFS